MVTVTDSAKEELKRIIEVKNLDPGRYLRLTAPPVWQGEGDFGIVIDEQGNEDHVVGLKGLTVLLVDPGLLDHLSNAVFDFKDSPNGSRFTLDVF